MHTVEIKHSFHPISVFQIQIHLSISISATSLTTLVEKVDIDTYAKLSGGDNLLIIYFSRQVSLKKEIKT